MTTSSPPTAEEQLAFLGSFQRLLDEGSFTSSYKFALLHAIADLCIVKGEDGGGQLKLSTADIAEQFIRLYWPQVRLFGTRDENGILSQNTGPQAAIVREVAEQHACYQGSLTKLERSDVDWRQVRNTVEVTVKRMPLWKLQTVGSERLDFLYENMDSGAHVLLKPGVAYCFRVFYPMVVDMIEGAWSHFVRRRNPQLLGNDADLRSFLFGAQRASLNKYRDLLREVQRGRCFYCDKDIRRSAGDVDHFIPWRLVAWDLGHNFVLAHQGCNSSKSDLLAAEEHLERWTKRNLTRREELETRFDESNVPYDLPTSYKLAHYAYSQVYRNGGQVWVQARERRLLSPNWESILPAA